MDDLSADESPIGVGFDLAVLLDSQVCCIHPILIEVIFVFVGGSCADLCCVFLVNLRHRRKKHCPASDFCWPVRWPR